MRGSAYPGGPSGSVELPIQVTNLKAWWDSRTTAQMPPSPETGISSWTSRAGSMGPVALSQATPASRPLWVASVPQLGGRPGVLFDGVDDALSALTASDWTFLHAGVGATVFMMLRCDSAGPADQPLLTTSRGSSSFVGVYCQMRPTYFGVTNSNGVAFVHSLQATAVPHYARDVVAWHAWTYAAGTCKAYVSGGSPASQADVGGQSPSSASPEFALRLGRGFTSSCKGWVAQLLIYDRELSAAEVNSLGAFFEAQYPEVPQQIPGLKCWFDSRTSAQMDLVSGAVQNWRSRAGSMGPVALSQAMAANRPLYVASAAEVGNRPAVQLDGANDVLTAGTPADWTFLHNGTGSTIFAVMRMDSTGPTNQQLFGTYGAVANMSGVWQSYAPTQLSARIGNGSGSAYNSAVTTNAVHIQRDVARWLAASHITGTRKLYGGGAPLVTQADAGGQSPSSGLPQLALQISGIGAEYLKGWITQLLIYDRALSDAEVAQLGAWAAAEYGVAA